MHLRHLLACCTAVSMLLSWPVRAATPDAVFKLEPYRSTVALRARIAGQEGLFVFDTGGGHTLVTPQFAAKAGLKPWGRITGYQMKGIRLDNPHFNGLTVVIDGKEFRAPMGGVLDIMSFYPKDAQPVDGLLALDIFDGKAITIDFPARTLTVESPESLRERVAGATELPMSIAREAQGRTLSVSVAAPTKEGPVWLEIDSGNGGTILISKPYAALFGLDPGASGPQQASFELAKGLVVKGRAFTPDLIIDGNIGMPFLKDVAVTMDLSARRLWIKGPAR